MNYSENMSDSTRLAMVTEVRELKYAAQMAVNKFSDDLTSYTTSDGVVFYGLEDNEPSAAVLSETDADSIELKNFRTQHITGRSVDLSVSALGKQLTRFRDTIGAPSQFEKSLIGAYRHRHLTLALPPMLQDGSPIAVVQLAIDQAHVHQSLDTDVAETIWKAHRLSHQEIAEAFHDVSIKYNKPLKNTLELLPPSTPNAVIVRWDLDNSTKLATGPRYGTMRNYLDDWRLLVEQATATLSNVVINGGDGQIIIIPLPGNMNIDHISDPTKISQFNEQRIIPLLERLDKGQLELQTHYPDLGAVHVSIAAEIGHVEKDSDGNFDGPVLWEAAKKTKK
jgi:hypothetical protein